MPAFSELIPKAVIEEYVKTSMPMDTYYHFYLIGQQSAHIIVPGKRDRNYRVEKRIAEGDEIVRIEQPEKRPDYISREEWDNLPKDMLLRRIS